MLILLVRLIVLAALTLWSFLTRIIFSTIAYLLVLLIQSFKVPGDAVQGGFQQIADAIRACFELIFDVMMEAVNFVVTKLFDVVKESVIGTVGATVSAVGGVAESMKTSFEEALGYLGELSEEISGMVTKMVEQLWNNCNDAVGYVTENIA